MQTVHHPTHFWNIYPHLWLLTTLPKLTRFWSLENFHPFQRFKILIIRPILGDGWPLNLYIFLNMRFFFFWDFIWRNFSLGRFFSEWFFPKWFFSGGILCNKIFSCEVVFWNIFLWKFFWNFLLSSLNFFFVWILFKVIFLVEYFRMNLPRWDFFLIDENFSVDFLDETFPAGFFMMEYFLVGVFPFI